MGPLIKPDVIRPKRSRTRKVLVAVVLDIILLPLAIVVVLFEDVLWRAAQALLRGLGSSAPMRTAHAWVPNHNTILMAKGNVLYARSANADTVETKQL